MSKLLVPVALAVMVSLAGCGQTAETPTASSPSSNEAPSSMPSSEPPAAQKLLVAGTEFSIVFDDGTTETFSFASDPAVAIDALAAALDAPAAVTDVPTAHCSPASTSHEWDGIAIGTGSEWLPEGQNFVVRVTSPTAGSISLFTGDGVAVGDSVDDALAAIDGEEVTHNDYEGKAYDSVYFDIQAQSDSGTNWGGYLWGVDNVVESFSSPQWYATSDC